MKKFDIFLRLLFGKHTDFIYENYLKQFVLGHGKKNGKLVDYTGKNFRKRRYYLGQAKWLYMCGVGGYRSLIWKYLFKSLVP